MSAQLRTVMVFALGFFVLAASLGCESKSPRKTRNYIGRAGRGPVGANATPWNPTSGGTQWGEITGSDPQSYQSELFYFTQPMLSQAGVEEQLGYVAPQRGQATGVSFWGEVPVVGGQIDGSRSRLHMEIYDDRTGQVRSDGSIRSQISVHIGYDQDGFVSALGYMSGGQANLVFTDGVGAVGLQGTISGGYFTGTVTYSNSFVSGMRTLGQFQVPACGFFICNGTF